MKLLFEIKWLGNPLYEYVLAIIIVFIGLIITRFAKKWITKRLKGISEKSKIPVFSYMTSILEKTIFPVFYYVIFIFAIKPIDFTPAWQKTIDAVGMILIAVAVVRFFMETIDFSLQSYAKKNLQNTSQIQGLKGLSTFANLILWIFGAIAVMKTLGYDVNSILTGFGITGIAVALAAQKILGDLFSYFSILFDKPFEQGDFIVFGDYMGNIENIGIRSTRIRSLSGEQVVIANSLLTESSLKNFKRMTNRRGLFRFGVVQDTPVEKLKKIPLVVKDIIDQIPHATFERAHFIEIGSFSFIYEVSYTVDVPDYATYLDIHQRVNLDIKEAFEQQKIAFALPTQTVIALTTEVKKNERWGGSDV